MHLTWAAATPEGERPLLEQLVHDLLEQLQTSFTPGSESPVLLAIEAAKTAGDSAAVDSSQAQAEGGASFLHATALRRSVRAFETLMTLLRHGGLKIKDTNERSANTLLRQDHGFNNANQNHVIMQLPLGKFVKMFGTVLANFTEADDAAQKRLANEYMLAFVDEVSAGGKDSGKTSVGELFATLLDALSEFLGIFRSACWGEVSFLKKILTYLCEGEHSFLISFAEPVTRFFNAVFECMPSAFYDRRLLKKFNTNVTIKLLDAGVISAYLNEQTGTGGVKRARAGVAGGSSSNSTAAKRAKKRKLNQRKAANGDDGAGAEMDEEDADAAEAAEQEDAEAAFRDALSAARDRRLTDGREKQYYSAASSYLKLFGTLSSHCTAFLDAAQAATVHEQMIRTAWLGLHDAGNRMHDTASFHAIAHADSSRSTSFVSAEQYLCHNEDVCLAMIEVMRGAAQSSKSL